MLASTGEITEPCPVPCRLGTLFGDLEEAFAIGRKSEPVAFDVVRDKLANMREEVAVRATRIEALAPKSDRVVGVWRNRGENVTRRSNGTTSCRQLIASLGKLASSAG
jgi:hypothetical protein